MSAGKSEVARYSVYHTPARGWHHAKDRDFGEWVKFKDHESLLLDARAAIQMHEQSSAIMNVEYGKLIEKFDRAEALAGESSRQLDLYRKAVNEIDDRIEYSTFNRDAIYAILAKLTADLAAIDAVGGRGKT